MYTCIYIGGPVRSAAQLGGDRHVGLCSIGHSPWAGNARRRDCKDTVRRLHTKFSGAAFVQCQCNLT